MVINIKKNLIDNIKVGDVIVTPTDYYMIIVTTENKFTLLNLENGNCTYIRKTLIDLLEIISKSFKIIKIINSSQLELNEIQE